MEQEAILKRLETLLNQQGDCFRKYLMVLEKQKIAIESGNTEVLGTYVELEQQVIADIFSIQNVIEPLEAMLPATAVAAVGVLKTTLEDLKTRILAQSACNQELLAVHMQDLRGEISILYNNPFANSMRSRYNGFGTASVIDIKG